MTTTPPLPNIRKFDAAAIEAGIERALAKVPKGEVGAVVAVAHSDGTTRLALAWRVNRQWSFGGYIEKDSIRPLEYGAEVRFSR